ncbi:MAG: acetylglutamate kinase, partial [Phycisphaerales bacterium]|nr:acetylglutamate kinase [Phycisphaerales bacterium]
MPFERDVLINLLHNMGSRREIDQYLRLFTGVDSMQFAVIKVGGGVMEESLSELASALAFLRKVGLFPIIVHGGGPQLNRELEARGISSTFVDGFRVTTPEVLAVARRVFQAEGAKLAAALEGQGVRARPISSGVFTAVPMDPQRFGLVGDVESVDLSMIEDTIRAGQLPIVASLGETAEGQILNVNADVAARELALTVRPQKIIFITPTGGLLDESGRIIPAINLAEDYERLAAAPWVYGGFARKLEEIKSLLDALPEWSSVSITSPDHLARELFTHRGMGTLVRR